MSFRAGALAMLTGTVVAQAIPLAISPLLTRLYSPEAIGLQTLYMGLAAALAVVATCRYDLAVVLADDDEEVAAVSAAVLGMTACLCAVLVAGAAVAAPWFATRAGHGNDTGWVWLLPAMVAGTALMQLSSSLASRSRDFGRIATANVANQATYAACAIAFGFAGAHIEGLVTAKTSGQWVGAATVVGGAWYVLTRLHRVSWASVCAAVKKYRQFLLFNAPYSLVGNISRDMPIFVFSAISSAQAAGFYGLARMVLMAPALLLSGALSQVFYREAVALRGSARLQALTLALLRLGLLAAAPLFAFCAVWSDGLFAMLFGPEWRQGGTFAMLLAPAAWMALQTGWPERLFEVAMRQDVSFRVQISADIIIAAAVVAPLLAGKGVVMSVGAFALATILYHTAYLHAIFRVSGFESKRLARELLLGWGVFGVSAAFLAGVRYFATVSTLPLFISAIASAAAAALLALRVWPDVVQSADDPDSAAV